jgi:hypothetical protein
MRLAGAAVADRNHVLSPQHIVRAGQFQRKRFGGDRAGFELTIGADADLAVKRLGW